MMRAILLTVLLGFFATSHGWVLDKSCGPYRDMILKGMKSVYSIADVSYDTLNRLPNAGTGPADQARRELVEYLFADALTNGNIDLYSDAWINATDAFGKVIDYKTNNEPESVPVAAYKSLRPTNLIMYCNYDRFKENQDCQEKEMKGVVCDTSIDRAFKMDSKYSDCKGGLFSSMQAWTYVWSKYKLPSVIQLCPGYLEKVKGHKYLTFGDQSADQSADQSKEHGLARAKQTISKFFKNSFRTAMDLKVTFDAVLLHEITHAFPDGHETFDVKEDDSYGWKNCHNLRKHGTRNADSYALFGIGAKMISERGERPMQDGTIQVLPQLTPKKRDSLLDGHSSPLEGRAPDPDTTLTLDHAAVTLDPSDAATLGNGALPTDGSAVIYDVHTVFFPEPSEPQGEPANPNPVASSSSNPPSTFRTSTRRSGVPNLSSSGAIGRPSSSKLLPDPTPDSSTPAVSASGGPAASSVVLGSSSGVAPGAPSSGSPSDMSSSGLSSSDLAPASSPAPESPSSASPLPGSSSGSRVTAVIISTTDAAPVPSMSESAGVSSNRITPAPSSNAVKTVTSGSSTSEVPITVVNVSKDGTTTPVTYSSTYTSSEGIEPTGAWMCTGPLCDTNSGCMVPLFCSSDDDDDISGSWGLLGGWQPPAPPDGGPPAPGGPPVPPPAGSIPPSGSGEGNPDGDDKNDDNSSTESSSTETSSSGSSTSSSSTSSSSSEVIDPAPTGDNFLAADPKGESWYEIQQSALAAAYADTTDPYITWSPTPSSSKPVIPASSPKPSSSTPASSSSPVPEETPAETTSEEEPEPTSTEETDPESTEPAPPSPSTPVITPPASSPTAPNDAPDSSATPSSPPVTPKSEPTTKYVDGEFWGEVLEYPSQTISSVSVNGMTVTHLHPAGEPTTLQTPMPSLADDKVDNDGSSMCRVLTTGLCWEAWDKFRSDAMNSDNQFELLPGTTDHYSHKVFSVFWNYQCLARLKCPDDHPGMSGLQAYKAFDEMFNQDIDPVSKCGHYTLDNGCTVKTDYHSTF